MSSITQGLSIVALRGNQGGRDLYQVLIQNSAMNNFFTINMDPPSEKSQRQLDPKHARDIRDYIQNNPDGYVLGTLIYAVDQECIFTPFKESEGAGVLTIPFGTNMRSIDGQHRRQGLNEAIDDDEQFAQDHTSVLIYVEPDVSKRRQMFSDMNATPKVVAKAINVAFDSRDPFALAAQELARSHDMLKGRVEMDQARVGANSQNLYTLGAVHDALKRLFVGQNGRVRTPVRFTEEEIMERGRAFFTLLQHARAELAPPSSRRTASNDILRHQSLLYSSTTLRVIAGAVHDCMQRDGEATTNPMTYTKSLRAVDFSPAAEPWVRIGFVSPGKSTPNARNQEVRAATLELVGRLKAAAPLSSQ